MPFFLPRLLIATLAALMLFPLAAAAQLTEISPAPLADAATLRAQVLDAARAGQPRQDLALPPLRFDSRDRLLPEDRALLSDLGHLLARLGPGRSVITFTRRAAPGSAAQNARLAETDRINLAYGVLAFAAETAAPQIAFDVPTDLAWDGGTAVTLRLTLLPPPGAQVTDLPVAAGDGTDAVPPLLELPVAGLPDAGGDGGLEEIGTPSAPSGPDQPAEDAPADDGSTAGLEPAPGTPAFPLPEVPLPAAGDPPPDPGAVGALALGQALDLPPLEFAAGTATLTPASAELLAVLTQRTGAAGADRFRLFLLPQATPGLSPEADVQLELARFRAIGEAMASRGQAWPGAVGFAPSPPKASTLTDSQSAAIQRLALPEADAPDWAQTPGAPPDYDAMRFGEGDPGRIFGLSDHRMATSHEGMIDLWTSPEWTRLNGFDPTLFSIGASGQTTLSLHMLDSRAGLAVWTGVPGLYFSVPHDFSANRPYHIALIVTPGEMMLMVDGVPLEPAIPLPPGLAAPTQMVLGDDDAGESRFAGRIGRLRIWHAVPAAPDLARVRQGPDLIPADFDPLAASLSSVIWLNFQTGAMEMRQAPVQQNPENGWWATLGEGDIRIQNADAFNRGTETPVFSAMQDDWQDANLAIAARPQDPGNPGAFGPADDAQLNPHFAVRHAVRLTADEGIDLDALRYPRPADADLYPRRAWQRGDPNWGLRILSDADGVLMVVSARCSTSRRSTDRWTCPDATRPGETMIPFDTDEYVTGLFWQLTDRGLRSLSFSTNKRMTPPQGGTRGPEEKLLRDYALHLPAGVTPDAFVTYYNVARQRALGVGLDFNPLHSRPGVTLLTETGAGLRFVREGDDRFISAQGDLGPLRSLPGAQPVRDLRLWVFGPGRIQIDGLPQEFILWPDHPAAEPGTAYNDTFVSLSKAVNLQASFMGYDAVEMDPLHLTRTGTHHPVFQMPDGDSTAYYDANRVFVPRGLHYFPEYTGKHHASVTTADTYSEYFDSFSDTVSFGIGGKAAPGSFSASATMSGARKAIAEAKHSRTRGLSRAVFYDLVLDAQQMQLDPLFVAEAERMALIGSYDSFIDTFGTHYPIAVVYGGLGVLEIDATESMRETMRQKGISIKLEASVMLDAATKTSASFGYEHSSEHAETFRDVLGSQVENFYWIGGTHAGASNSGWTVGTDGVVPVHVQLRPLWELLSPLHFDDPAVYDGARLGLKTRIDKRMAEAAANLPAGQDDDSYVVELRVDAVACTRDPASAMREPAQATHGDNGISLTAKPVRMFPMVGLAVIDGQQGLLRNLEAHEVSDTTDYKALTVHCPSQTDIQERSPYAAANALFRYQMTAEDILSGRASMIVLDRIDLESRVLSPPVDTKSSEVKTKAFLAGLTLGISVLVDELTNDDGSPLVRLNEKVSRPNLRQVPHGLNGRLCPAGQPCPRSKADLDRLSGQWIRQSDVMPSLCPSIIADLPVYFCQPRRVDYSVRIVK